MCSDRLKTRIADVGPERLAGIEEIFLEISDRFAAEALSGSKSQTLGSATLEVTPVEEEEWEATGQCQDWECWVCGLAPKRARTEEGDGDVEMRPVTTEQAVGASKGGGKKGGTNGKGGKSGKRGSANGVCYICVGASLRKSLPFRTLGSPALSCMEILAA